MLTSRNQLVGLAVVVLTMLSPVVSAGAVGAPHAGAEHTTVLASQPTASQICPASFPAGEWGSWPLVGTEDRSDVDPSQTGGQSVSGAKTVTCWYEQRDESGASDGATTGSTDGSTGHATFAVTWVYDPQSSAVPFFCADPGAAEYEPGAKAIRVSWQGSYPPPADYDPSDASAEEWFVAIAQTVMGPDDPRATQFGARLRAAVEPYAVPCDAARQPTTTAPTPAPTTTADADGTETAFAGYVLTTTEERQVQDLEDVRVVLHVTDGGTTRAFTTFTDVTGVYRFSVPDVGPTARYRLDVQFQDSDPTFAVTRAGASTLLPVGYATPSRSVKDDATNGLVLENFWFGSGMADPERSRLLPDGSTVEGTQWTALEVHEAALVYSNVQTAVAYARGSLNLSLGGGNFVRVNLDPACPTSHMNAASRTIGICGADVTTTSFEHPEVEHHEFGHYVHYVSAMGGVDNMARISGENHGGVLNPNSVDSVMEGWASYFAVMVRTGPVPPSGAGEFSMGPIWVDFQDNRFETYKEVTDETGARTVIGPVPDEEYMVASLLWDLMDDDSVYESPRDEPEDRVAWGFSRVWKTINTDELSDVRSLYELVKAEAGEPLPGPNDPPTDIDRLFVFHRFYSENNGQEGWQQGEPIGYADFDDSEVDPRASWGPATPPPDIRRVPPAYAGAWLDVDVTDEAGRALPVSGLRMEVLRGTETAVTDLRPAPGTSRYPIDVPPDADLVRLSARVPGYATGWVDVTREDVLAYRDSWGEQVGTLTVSLPARQVASPSGFAASRSIDGSVALSWADPASGSRVVVRRQVGEPPQTPADGVRIYEGTGGGVVDEGPSPVGETHYAAFLVDATGGVSQPATATSSAPPLTREQLGLASTGQRVTADGAWTPAADGSGAGGSGFVAMLDDAVPGGVGAIIALAVFLVGALGYWLGSRKL
jgi:hypothetical protein